MTYTSSPDHLCTLSPGHSIRAVVFDIDGTLVDFQRVLESALTEVGQEFGRLFGRAFTAEELQQIRNEVSSEPQFVSAHLEEKRRESLRRALAFVGDAGGKHLDHICDFFFKRRFATCHIYPDVIPTLKQLQNHGLMLIAASNGNSYLTDTPLAHFLNFTLYADDLGAEKPEHRFYAAITEKIDVSPSQILHVGDSFENDHEGPRTFGMESLLLCRSCNGVASQPFPRGRATTHNNYPASVRPIATLAAIPALLFEI